MKIIYGQSLVNELNKLCLRISNRLWIAVPYIGNQSAVVRILGEKWISNKSISLRLLTDISDLTCIDLDTLSLFMNDGHVKSLVGLHAKIYIVDNSCIITSANLTETAFTKRHEIGLSFDVSENHDIINVFEEWWSNALNINGIPNIVPNSGKSSEEKRFISLPRIFDLPLPTNDHNNDWEKLFANKSEMAMSLFKLLNMKILRIGNDITRHTTNSNILYKTSLNFLEISPRNDGFGLLLRTKNNNIDDPNRLTSIVPKSYNWGNLTNRMNVRVPVQNDLLDEIMKLIVQAYESTK